MDSTGWILRMFGSLVLVLGLVYAASLLLKMMPRRPGLRAGRTGVAGKIRVLDSVALTAAATLHVVEVEGRRVVLGATGSSVSCVLELGAPSAAAPGQPGSPDRSAPSDTVSATDAGRATDAGSAANAGEAGGPIGSAADVAAWARRCADRLRVLAGGRQDARHDARRDTRRGAPRNASRDASAPDGRSSPFAAVLDRVRRRDRDQRKGVQP